MFSIKTKLMIEDYLGMAIGTFTHRPTRSWLTILGVFIGIAAVVGLTSLGQGLQDTVNKQFEQLGTDVVMVMPGTGSYGALAGVVSGSSRLTDHDINIIERTKGVEKAVGFMTTLAKVKDGDKLEYTFVIGYPPDKITLSEFGTASVEKGRELKSGDKYKVIVGYLIGKGEFFDKPVKVGDTIYVSDVKFEVVGIASRIGNRGDDTQVYLPMDTANEIYKEPGYAMIYTFTKKGFEPSDVADAIKDKMRRDRNLKKGAEDFTVSTTAQLMEVVGNVITVVQMIVIGIAAISLAVGGIGIMNTMYTSVLERTREIGIMKAIGAKNTDVMVIFLLESGILGLVGGIIGVSIGVGLGKIIEAVAQQSSMPFAASFSPLLIFGSLFFSFIIGALSGTLPALRAAQLKPIEALRYE
jgi:putative ABC transport system permease protein